MLRGSVSVTRAFPGFWKPKLIIGDRLHAKLFNIVVKTLVIDFVQSFDESIDPKLSTNGAGGGEAIGR